MSRLVMLVVLLAFTPTASADLHAAPGRTKLCSGTAMNPALAASCTGECKRVADKVCSSVAVAFGAGAPVLSSWQGAVISGLGTFIADRAQQEVAAWFEDLVRDKLCGLETNKIPWFPSTCKLIKDTAGAGQQLASPLVIAAVKADIPSLLVGLTSRFVSGTSPEFAAFLPALAVAGLGVREGASPLAILSGAAKDTRVLAACRARAYPSAMTGPCLLVFAGITVDHFGPLITAGTDDIEAVKSLAVELLAQGDYRCEVINAITGTQACISPAGSDAGIPDNLMPLLDATVITTPAKIDQLFKLVKDAGALDAALRTAQDGKDHDRIAAVLTLFDAVLDDALALAWPGQPPTAFAALRDVVRIGAAIAAHEYRAVLLRFFELAKDSGVELPEWAGRLLPLVTDLVEAQQAGDVSAALGRAAAPIGGWRLKRQKPLFSISALVGAGAGYEAPFRTSLGSQSLKGGPAAGLFAPIGFEVSGPIGKTWSFGVLASVLDLGQVTWARLEETNKTSEDAGTETLPEAKLAQVLSLGLYVVFGAGNSPFTFGAGASIAPDLRSYTYDIAGSATDRGVTVWRACVFAAVDVTVFPF